jgi:thiamine-monophosphate kinase
MSEFELIRRFFQRPAGSSAILGIGDDCALLRPPAPGQVLAISSDMLIEGRHFFAGTDPASLGHKSLAVNLSDLAAMGAEPLGFTLAIALPDIDERWLESFCRGLFALADEHGCPLVGGDTTRGPLAISITVFGQVPPDEALRRDRARIGDEVWVSGPLGGAAWAVARRSRAASGAGGQRAEAAGAVDAADAADAADARAARRLDWPQPRVALGQSLRGLAHAAIDLSDGLAGDLRHVLEASAGAEGLAADLVAGDLPLDPCLAGLPFDAAVAHALRGGDDYELLFTAPVKSHDAIMALCPEARMIGRLRAGRGILLTGRDGTAAALEGTGFDHFSG